MNMSNGVSPGLRIAFILLASTLTVMAGATLAPALPDMQRHFQHLAQAELLVKMVIALPGLVVALSAPLVGLLVDRWRRKPLLLGATLLYALSGCSGFFLESSLTAILVGRLLLGFAVAGVMVVTTTLIADYYPPPQRGRVIGLQAAFGGFGGVLFMMAGGVMSDLHWTLPFLLYGLALLLLPGLNRYVNEPEWHTEISEQNAVTSDIRRVFVSSCYVMAVVEMIALYMVPLHLPFYLRSQPDWTVAQPASIAGLYIGVMLLMMSLVSMFYARLRRYIGFLSSHGLGLLLLAIGYAGIGMSDSLAGLLVALLVSGVGLGIMRPNLVTGLMSAIPVVLRGRIMGGITSAFFIGQFVAPLVTQPMVDNVGYGASFILLAVLILLLALLYFFYAAYRHNSLRECKNPS